MRYMTSLILIVLSLIFCGGCTIVREIPQAKQQEESTTDQHKLCRLMLECFLKNDASGFVDLLPEDVRKNFDTDQFRKTRKQITETYGEPISFQFVTELDFPSVTPRIWKVRFRHKLKNGDYLYREALFRILTNKAPQKPALVIGFNFL